LTATPRRIGLKVDCDTFEGTRAGIPALLRLFDEAKVRATFFFTLGPDRSGLAVRRVFTQKGFLKKMLRSKAVSLYGPKTMLYGTLLPAPDMGKLLKADIASVAAAGHEVGAHGWDHVRWHDYLDRYTDEEIRREVGAAHAAFESIFGRPARCSAAPGWHATPASLAVQESFGIRYASDTRGGAPFFPKAGGRVFKFLEIPTTLPTWDEALADPSLAAGEPLINYYRAAVRGDEVFTLHTEVEGGTYAPLFRRQLAAWAADGAAMGPLSDIADRALAHPAVLPAAEIARVTIPHRGGYVTSRAARAATLS
jgi:peptidoglycan/xylan/chitin deacetylase (PgdA/CDA1 family)